MKFYLGGGRNPDGSKNALQDALEVAKQIFDFENTKQILHVPFARTGIMKKNRDLFSASNFGPYVDSLGIKYLSAAYYEDIETFEGDTMYINGGNSCNFLLQMCTNEKLLEAISKARVIVCESCGAMIMSEYFRQSSGEYAKGFGYIQDTIIEPHYTERGNQERLEFGMKEFGITYGLGIDENTFIQYENGVYGTKVGAGNVFRINV